MAVLTVMLPPSILTNNMHKKHFSFEDFKRRARLGSSLIFQLISNVLLTTKELKILIFKLKTILNALLCA